MNPGQMATAISGNSGMTGTLVRVAEISEQLGHSPISVFQPLLRLDTMKIYDKEISILFREVAKEDHLVMFSLIYGAYPGIEGFDTNQLKRAIASRGQGFDSKKIVAAVKADFAPNDWSRIASEESAMLRNSRTS